MNSRTVSIFARLVSVPFMLASVHAHAELTFDNDTGESLAGDMVIDADQGITQGTNLLHSFIEFNVQSGESATFTGPDAIDNIIARVTGTEASLIDGPLRSTIASADLFLLNPNGLMVTSGASIEIDGSLHLSTASSVTFEDGSQLLVSDSGASGFTTAAPSAFGFGLSAADIMFEGVTLSRETVVDSLSLAAGDITISNSELLLPGKDVDLMASGDVTLSNDAMPLEATIDTSGDPAGRITIAGETMSLTRAFIFSDSEGVETGRGIAIDLAGSLTLAEESRITADVLDQGDGGNIVINAASLTLDGFDTRISSDTRSFSALGAGDGGSLNITVGDLIVRNEAIIAATTNGPGDAGSIVIEAASVSLTGAGQLVAQTNDAGRGGLIDLSSSGPVTISGAGSGISTFSSGGFFVVGGDAGEIVLQASSLGLGDGAVISSESFFSDSGAPGKITIDVAGDVTIAGASTVSTNNNSASADGGEILITADSLVVKGADADSPEFLFSAVQSSSSNVGRGGDIVIDVAQFTVDAGAAVEARADGEGDAGSISITGSSVVDGGRVEALTTFDGRGGTIALTGDVVVTGGGRIDTSTPESGVRGDAGEISISGPSLLVTGEGSSIASFSGGDGAAGSIDITSQRVTVTEGGAIDTRTTAAGTGGAITIEGASLLTVSGAGSSVTSSTEGAATGGTIAVSAGSIAIVDSGRITVTATGTGNAGNIGLIASNRLDVLDAGAVETNAALSGGGSINIDVIDTIYLRDATVTASSGGPEVGADGGNIRIDPIFFILDNSAIVAQAVQGNGGIIDLFADNFIRDVNSLISATSELGNDGEVTITTPDTSVTGVVGVLPASFSREDQLLSEPCAAQALDDRSSLIVERTGDVLEPSGAYAGSFARGCGAPQRN